MSRKRPDCLWAPPGNEATTGGKSRPYRGFCDHGPRHTGPAAGRGSRLALAALAGLIAAAPLAHGAPSPDDTPRLQKVDPRDAPRLRLYVEVPDDPAWEKARAWVRPGDRLSPADREALEAAHRAWDEAQRSASDTDHDKDSDNATSEFSDDTARRAAKGPHDESGKAREDEESEGTEAEQIRDEKGRNEAKKRNASQQTASKRTHGEGGKGKAAPTSRRSSHRGNEADEADESTRKKAGLPVVPPPLPPEEVTAKLVPYDRQDDPAEALELILLVDASGSMLGNGGIDEARALVEALASAVRPIDRLALVAFDERTRLLVKPTTDHRDVTRTLAKLTDFGKKTHLFDAVDSTLRGRVAEAIRQAAPWPTLPGRVHFFVISDGLDEGSRLQLEDLRGSAKDVQVYTVAVGRTHRKTRSDPTRDLARLAKLLGGSSDWFFDRPEPSELADAFVRRIRPLRRILLVEADLPVSTWKVGEHRAALRIAPAQGPAWTQEFAYRVTKLDGAHLERRKRFDDDIVKLRKWHDDHKARKLRHERWRWAALGGGVLLVLLGIILGLRRRAVRRREEEARAERAAEEQARREAEERVRGELEALREAQAKAQEELLAAQSARERQIADQTRTVIAEILGLDGPLRGQRFGLLKPRVVAGRDPNKCDVVFPSNEGADLAISRVHAEFSLQGGSWTVCALSDGGVSVEGRFVPKGARYPLRPGDRLGLGQTLFEFRLP